MHKTGKALSKAAWRLICLVLLAAGCRAGHAPHHRHRRVHTITTRYLRAADVVGGTELDTGRYEVAHYLYQSDVPHVSDTWYQQEVFVKVRSLGSLPVGQVLAVPGPALTVQSYGHGTWYFEQFKGIRGTVTRLAAPGPAPCLRFDLTYQDAKQVTQPLLQRTLTFPLDSTYFVRTRHDFHGEYDDLRLALKEPLKVRKLDLTNWAIDYEKRHEQDSGPDPLYQQLGEFRNLEELSLKFSHLQELPTSVKQLQRLKVLDLSYNGLATFPLVLYQLDSLRELNLANNDLDSIPAAIAQLKSLRALNLDDNRLVRYPEAVNELTGLDSLCLGNANLRRLPASISRLRQLQMLGLNGFWNNKRHNQLANLNALVALPRLRRLTLQGNGLEKLPAAVYQLPSLEELDLKYNGLDSAAIAPKKLPRLKKLEL